jgi:hypothetical protein
LLIGTNAFWAFITHKLLNKVMSRTFWEYQQAKVIPKSEAQALKDALKEVKVDSQDKIEQQQMLDELDKRILGAGIAPL